MFDNENDKEDGWGGEKRVFDTLSSFFFFFFFQ